MKIASANLQMASRHEATQERQVKESLKMWIGPRRPNFEGEPRGRPQPESSQVQLSQAGKTAQSLDTDEAKDVNDLEEQIDNDPKLSLLRSVIEMITGRKMKIFNAAELQNTSTTTPATPAAPTQENQAASTNLPAGFGVEYDYHESYAETEMTSFSAQGVVRTEDGREISFKLDLTMARSYYEESNVSIRAGDAVVKDPLVLNFNGTAAQLTDTRFNFDLDANGSKESINFVAPGSGFLVFDRNQDGKINDGRELFGAISGDGFKELAELDQDRNGWIDENDAAYKNLQIWSKDAQGQDQLQTLQQANVGAISLAQVSTPFDIKDQNNQLQGKIQATGVFLQETGGAGTMQKIDLKV